MGGEYAEGFVHLHAQLRTEPDGRGVPPKLGGDRFEVESAGLEPGKLNPYVVRALREEGIDISGKPPRGSSICSSKAGSITS